VALGRDLARVSSSIAAALLLPLTVLAGDGGGTLFLLAKATFLPTTGFFGRESALYSILPMP